MTSSTSSSRLARVWRYVWALRAVFYSLLIFAAIEALLSRGLTHDMLVQQARASALMEMNYLKHDVGQKTMISRKVSLFAGKPAEFIVVGDSSGAYGLMPRIVEQYLDGMTMLNTNCCADIGWPGYAYTADYFLRHSPNAKYLLLHVTPYSLPGQYHAGFSGDIYGFFSSPYRAIFLLPSLYWRETLLNHIYRHDTTFLAEDIPIAMRNMGIDAKDVIPSYGHTLDEAIQNTHGWLPYYVKPSAPYNNKDDCGVHMLEYAYDRAGLAKLPRALSRVWEVANRYGVELIVVFNPVGCRDNDRIARIHQDIKDFAETHPHTTILLPFIRTWPLEAFSDEWHLNPEYAPRHSHEVGKALREWLKQSTR